MSRVYFIRPVGMVSPIKIGCSVSPDGRRSTLETWSPFPLEIIAEIEGSYETERRFHAKFVDQHLHHEWFSWSTELQGVVDAVASGAFDIETLPSPQLLPSKKGGRAKGFKWTDAEREASRRRHALNKAMKRSGLVLDYPHDADRIDAFVADPAAHGVTQEVFLRRCDERSAQRRRDEAEQIMAKYSLTGEPA